MAKEKVLGQRMTNDMGITGDEDEASEGDWEEIAGLRMKGSELKKKASTIEEGRMDIGVKVGRKTNSGGVHERTDKTNKIQESNNIQ